MPSSFYRGKPVPQFLDEIRQSNTLLAEAVDFFRQRITGKAIEEELGSSCINTEEAEGVGQFFAFLGHNLKGLEKAAPEQEQPLREKIAQAEMLLAGILSEGRTKCKFCLEQGECLLESAEDTTNEASESDMEQPAWIPFGNTHFSA